MLAILLAAMAASAPPVVAMSADQLIATLSEAWTVRGEPAFKEQGQPAAARTACSGPSLCIALRGGSGLIEAITLTGPAETQTASGRYLSAQPC